MVMLSFQSRWYILLLQAPIVMGNANIKGQLEDIIVRLDKLEVQVGVLEFVRSVKVMIKFASIDELGAPSFRSECALRLKDEFKKIRTRVSDDARLLQLLLIHFNGSLEQVGQPMEFFFRGMYNELLKITE
jgi:hypothetical protein